MNLSKAVKFTKIVNNLTASQTETSSTILDMQGYDGVMFVLSFGSTVTTANVTTLIARNSTANSAAGMTNISGGTATATALAASSNNGCLSLDVFRPVKRYVDVDITRTAANAVIDGVTAIQYAASVKPQTNDTTTFLQNTSVIGS